MLRITEGEVKLMVESWNAHQRVGTAVRVLLDDGSFRKTKTRSEAWGCRSSMRRVQAWMADALR